MLITDNFIFHLESEDITLTLKEPASLLFYSYVHR